MGGYWVFQLAESQWDYFADHLRQLGLEVVEPKVRRAGHAVIGAARITEGVGRSDLKYTVPDGVLRAELDGEEVMLNPTTG